MSEQYPQLYGDDLIDLYKERDELRAKLFALHGQMRSVPDSSVINALVADLTARAEHAEAELAKLTAQTEALATDKTAVWVNMLAGKIAIPSNLVERKELEEVKAALDAETLNRIGCEYAMIELRRCCGLDTTQTDLREVAIHIEAIKISEGSKTRAEQAEARVLEWENREAAVCPEDTAFENVIGDLRAKLEQAESSRDFCREWYSQRFERLSKFIREEIPEPQKTRYFSIIANGAADVNEQNTYGYQMNLLRIEKEQAEAKCAAKDEALQCVSDAWSTSKNPDWDGMAEAVAVAREAISPDCGTGWLSPDKVKVLREALGIGKPWPVSDILRSLAFGAQHLLQDHNCDHQGHETISYNMERAHQMAKEIEQALAATAT
jgi:hypothetical protein